MDGSIKSFNKVQCTKWLKEIGQSATGTLEQLHTRIEKFSVYPKLLSRLKAKTERNYKFECSLDPLDIPQWHRIVFFNGLTPKKAHCSCPVGASGLCCHVLALMLFLKHYHDTSEKIFELTCTQQLQKWHRY